MARATHVLRLGLWTGSSFSICVRMRVQATDQKHKISQDWDGHEQPLHVGLDPEIRKGFIDQLDVWKGQCKQWVETGKYCLTMPNASSIRNAMALARRSEYTQEVCLCVSS